ncbi:MAG TPA: hypothetical protein PKD64_12060 [Pirellulaceae bacterium]|nr:hypothetical protein [Pirellulaceae bacterium]HMO92920.1 hypothetical protein [Pirellulaceae bacterium]HMP71059.1 hypothetical protein [Pirellulaceae bacterium]
MEKSLLVIAFCWTLVPVHSLSQENKAVDLEKAFLSNIQSIVTCELRVEECAAPSDFSAVSGVIDLKMLDEKVRIDRLRRIIQREGIEMEQLEQFWFDGKTTTEFFVRLPGIERETNAGEDCGIRCLIYGEKDERVISPLQKCIGLQTFAIREVRPLLDAIRDAKSCTLLNDENHTLLYSLDDLKEGENTYKNRIIRIELSSEHGWWPKRINYACEVSSVRGQDKLFGAQTFSEFQDLGSGRFFPGRLNNEFGYSDESNLSQGPSRKISLVSLNQPVDESTLPIELPVGVIISTQKMIHGDLGRNSLSIKSTTGEIRTFSDQNAVREFQSTALGEDQWKGRYVPPIGFPYYFDTAEKAADLKEQLEGRRRTPTASVPGTDLPTAWTSGRIAVGSGIAVAIVLFACFVIWKIRRVKSSV